MPRLYILSIARRREKKALSGPVCEVVRCNQRVTVRLPYPTVCQMRHSLSVAAHLCHGRIKKD